MAYNVFISYSSKNLHIVDWARATLAQPGATEVFAAEYSVLPSQVLNDEIVQAIRACDLFVLLWSHDARASDYVPQEIGIAVGCNKTILPVVMEGQSGRARVHHEPEVSPGAQELGGLFSMARTIRSRELREAQEREGVGRARRDHSRRHLAIWPG
jgi:hypothetical protein